MKRQCVIHGKPFISTAASARDWVEMERIHAGLAPDRQADRLHDYGNQTLALIAHDAMKPAMLEFCERNFALLSRYRRRVGTGTTGQKLNELAWSKGWPADKPWVDRYNSGPLGETRKSPTWCWSAAASARSSLKTRMWPASMRPISSCWSGR